jgi:hypothetical protein
MWASSSIHGLRYFQHPIQTHSFIIIQPIVIPLFQPICSIFNWTIQPASPSEISARKAPADFDIHAASSRSSDSTST